MKTGPISDTRAWQSRPKPYFTGTTVPTTVECCGIRFRAITIDRFRRNPNESQGIFSEALPPSLFWRWDLMSRGRRI